jgi:hypothetical protein
MKTFFIHSRKYRRVRPVTITKGLFAGNPGYVIEPAITPGSFHSGVVVETRGFVLTLPAGAIA